MKASNFSRLSLLAALLGTLTSCHSDKIFYATFEADTLGQRPNPSPPEDPTGDAIQIADDGNPNPETSQVLVRSLPAFSSKCLVYLNTVPPPSLAAYVYFKPIPVDPARVDHLFAYWNGYIDLANGPALDLFLGGNHFSPRCGLRFQNGQVYTSTATGSAPIGPFANRTAHLVYIDVDKTHGTYRVLVAQPRGHTLISPSQPISNAADLNTPNPILYMHYETSPNAPNPTGGLYALDNVTISTRAPVDMPNH